MKVTIRRNGYDSDFWVAEYPYAGIKAEHMTTSERKMIVVDATVQKSLRDTYGLELGSGVATDRERGAIIRDFGALSLLESIDGLVNCTVEIDLPEWLFE